MQNPISGNRVRRSLRRQGGFTLIEVMIVVVIVVILARVALPSYQSSVRKARRADAVDATTSILQVQERCRASQPTYAGSVSALATCISGSATALGTSKNGYYTMAVSQTGTTPLSTAYTLTATAVSGKGQENDSGCSTLTVSVSGGSPTYTPASCWSR